jgi:hypothetical protein
MRLSLLLLLVVAAVAEVGMPEVGALADCYIRRHHL